jgi:hypothetical protein
MLLAGVGSKIQNQIGKCRVIGDTAPRFQQETASDTVKASGALTLVNVKLLIH